MNKNRLFLYSIAAALTGFIFGFDTVVISGANQPFKELWHTSSLFHSFFIMSMSLGGTVLETKCVSLEELEKQLSAS